MSTFRDILDTISGLEGEVTDFMYNTRKQHSLSKTAMEGVLNFPVIVSNALTIEDASLISKALEREFASFVLVSMTMNPTLYTTSKNLSASDYIKKFHQNVDTRTNGTDVLNAATKMLQEAADKLDLDYESLEGLEETVAYKIYEGVNYPNINKENIRVSYTIQDVTNSSILNESVNRRISGISRPIMEAPTPNNTTTYNDDAVHVGNGGNYFRDVKVADNANSLKFGDIDNIDVNVNVQSPKGMAMMNRGTGRDAKQLQHMMDNDAKKANELVPTLLHMRVYPVDKSTNVELPPIDFVMGIKATLHPVSSDEMITNVCRGIKNENTFFNFLRWTTGEIRFLKDFVFGMNELKLDAVNSSAKASKWWSMLKRRKAMAKIKNVILPNKLLPNATIVITQEEVDTIKEVYGYDLTNTSLVYKMMENYFLIAFVIVDPALQRVKFLFDGRNQFETLTFATLAREATTNDKQFKEMLNMLGRRI